MPAHFLVSGNLQHSVLVVLTLWFCSITVCWWKRRRRRRIRWNDCHTVGKRVRWVHTDEDISVACKWTFALNFLIWFFPRPQFFKLHMEKPQKHASTHTPDTEAESSNKLNDQLYSWTLTTHPRKQELPRIRTNHPQHPAAKKLVSHTWSYPKCTDGRKKKRKGRRDSWLCPVPARATLHTLTNQTFTYLDAV